MNSDVFEDIPMILETPDVNRYKAEVDLLKSYILLRGNDKSK
jgi:endonuclease IV